MGIINQPNKRKKVNKNFITNEQYLNYINSLNINELIKEKLRVLINDRPSVALVNVCDNLNEFISRFEKELNEEIK